jgi:uncharacterized membrane protein
MKKIIAIVSAAVLFPAISFAQNYSYRMMGDYNNYGGGWNQPVAHSAFAFFLIALIPIIWFVFFILLFVFWVVMLIDAIKHSPEKMKIVWVLVIILTNVIGALIYYFVEKKPREKAKIEQKKED